jgi:fibronectin-binding autotransporter adhesin
VVSGNNVTLNDTGAIDLGACTISGALNVTAVATITDSGALAVTGTSTLSSTGGAGGITVDTAGNDFGGLVTLFSAGATDIVFRDANNASLAALTAGRDLSVSAGGTISMQGALSVARDLTISAGTLNLNNQTLDVNQNLAGAGTLAAAGSEAITVGGGFDPAGFTATSSTVTLDSSFSGNLGGRTFYNLIFNKAGFPAATLTSTGGLTVLNSLTLTEGTWDSASFTHDIQANWDATSANFTFVALDTSPSTIQLSTDPALTINHSPSNVFWNLVVRIPVSLLSDIVVLNDLTITATGTLDVTASSRQITVGHSWSRLAGGVFNPRNGWVVFNDNPFTVGGTLSSTDLAGETFYNLRITETGGTLLYSADLTVISEIWLERGALTESGTRLITMGTATSPAVVTWRNTAYTAGEAGFTNTAGMVSFPQPGSAVTYEIRGRTIFWDFECLPAAGGAVLHFEQNDTGTFLATDKATIVNGDFHVSGTNLTTNYVQMNNISGDNTLVLCGVNPGLNQWILQITGTATIDYFEVHNSWAPDTDWVTPGPNYLDEGNNCHWRFSIPIAAYWTLDTNNNGRIDRIRVQVEVGTQLSDRFVFPDHLNASVEGYTVLGFGTAGGANDDVFDILLAEGPYLDTDVKPRWQLLTNYQPDAGHPLAGLYGLIGGAYVQANDNLPAAEVPKIYTAEDGARPVIGYSLAVANQSRVYVHFSEPVYGDPGPVHTQSIAWGAIALPANNPTALSPEARSGLYAAHGAMLILTNPIAPGDIVPYASAQTLNAVAGAIYDIGYQPATDPGTYANTNVDGNLPAGSKPMLTTAHRLSDVGLGLADAVFAYTIGPQTQADPLRGGAGRITRFDGSAWLQDRDTQLQVNIQGVLDAGVAVAATEPILYFDVNPGIGLAPADPAFLQRLWIPSTAETLFANAGHDRLNNGITFDPLRPLTAVVVPPPAQPWLRDYVIPSSDPEIKDGADLQFLLLVNDGGGLFPLARIDDPLDPRTARPWSWKVRDLRAQRGDVTILNNVINPLRGEKTGLYYTLSASGYVTITVFDLKGDIVNVLYRGQRGAGEYSTTWDGRNRGGRIVARGLYFIKVVGPDVNEIRKVLVVK